MTHLAENQQSLLIRSKSFFNKNMVKKIFFEELQEEKAFQTPTNTNIEVIA